MIPGERGAGHGVTKRLRKRFLRQEFCKPRQTFPSSCVVYVQLAADDCRRFQLRQSRTTIQRKRNDFRSADYSLLNADLAAAAKI